MLYCSGCVTDLRYAAWPEILGTGLHHEGGLAGKAAVLRMTLTNKETKFTDLRQPVPRPQPACTASHMSAWQPWRSELLQRVR